jgi:hypothetical protein
MNFKKHCFILFVLLLLQPFMLERFRGRKTSMAIVTACTFVMLAGTAEKVAQAWPIKIVALNPDTEFNFEKGRVYYPNRAFFEGNTHLIEGHRTNSIEDINAAVSMGANVINFDITDFNEVAIAEHGYIFPGEILNKKFNLIFDVDGITTGNPQTLDKLMAYAASLSTPQNPLFFHLELKHGNFQQEPLLVEIAKLIKKYKRPTFIDAVTTEHQGILRQLINGKN